MIARSIKITRLASMKLSTYCCNHIVTISSFTIIHPQLMDLQTPSLVLSGVASEVKIVIAELIGTERTAKNRVPT